MFKMGQIKVKNGQKYAQNTPYISYTMPYAHISVNLIVRVEKLGVGYMP